VPSAEAFVFLHERNTPGIDSPPKIFLDHSLFRSILTSLRTTYCGDQSPLFYWPDVPFGKTNPLNPTS